jgi:YD repeat-containing protein
MGGLHASLLSLVKACIGHAVNVEIGSLTKINKAACSAIGRIGVVTFSLHCMAAMAASGPLPQVWWVQQTDNCANTSAKTFTASDPIAACSAAVGTFQFWLTCRVAPIVENYTGLSFTFDPMQANPPVHDDVAQPGRGWCSFGTDFYTNGILGSHRSYVHVVNLYCAAHYYDDALEINKNNQCVCRDGWTWVLDAKNKNGGFGACVIAKETLAGPPTASGQSCKNPGYGKPIHPLVGNETYEEPTGVNLGGQALRFNYDSILTPWGNSGTTSSLPGQVTLSGQLGKLWWSSFHHQLILSPNNVSLQAIRGGAVVTSFNKDSTGHWLPPADSQDSLVALTGGGFVYRDQGSLALETYDSTGKLTGWVTASGMTLTPAYTAANMSSVSDPFLRKIGFTYKTLGTGDVVIDTITDPTGQNTVAGYDNTTGNLTSLTWPGSDAAVRTFAYDSPNANQSWAFTGVIDENAKRYFTITYDPTGWATSSSLANGVDKYTISYTTPPKSVIREVYDAGAQQVTRYHEWQTPVRATITMPNGSQTGMNTAVVLGDPALPNQGSPRSAGMSQPAGAGCGASTSNLVYDANGNIKQHDDFNGHRTCSAYDSNNRETSRIEGLLGGTTDNKCDAALAATSFTGLPAETRKISAKWHPDWALKVQQAEPQLLTTWVYNGQPDPTNNNQTASCAPSTALLPDDGSGMSKPIVVLCKKVEQATTDATGLQGLTPTLDNSDATITSQRQWTYTYNQYGQVLTSTGPQGTTTNAYYADTNFTGTAPNAVGHYMGDLYTVTNQAGHVTTYNSYDKAGRVLNMTDLNGLVTAYTYWPRGWVKASKQCSSGSACDVSTSGGGLRTTYDYWPTGLLKLVTQPDGSTLSYVYDDAHRLTDVTDNLGNTVHYTTTYDTTNKQTLTSQSVKDNTGTLTRNISKTFDALNRLQLVTGIMR